MKDGREISRAQAIQAEAAKTEPNFWMNPIMLKPASDCTSELILLGKSGKTLVGRDYRDSFYEVGLAAIDHSLIQLSKIYDIVVMEGAGSPVELNLRDKELVNMKVAELANVPVLLVADIDRGGVFASIVGTLELLSPSERQRVKGIVINKFRGDPSLFAEGIKWIEENTGIPVVGLIPVVDHAIEEEDSLSMEERSLQRNTETFSLQDNTDWVDKYDNLVNQIKGHLDWQRVLDIIERWQVQ